MNMNSGTPKSMTQAIRNAIVEADKGNKDVAQEIELHIIEFIRNRMNVVCMGGPEAYKAMKHLQSLIEFQDQKKQAA